MTIIARIFPGTRSLLTLACLAASLCSQAALAAANEDALPGAEIRAQQDIAQETSRHMLAGDFGRLEALYLRLTKSGERTPSGLWKLAIFYTQLRDLPVQTSGVPKWIEMQEQARQWQARYPKSVPARLVGAYAKLEEAELARAGQTLADMPDMQRMFVNIYALDAMRMLEKARPLATKANDPEWHRAVLSVAPYLDSTTADSYRKQVSEALARHPDYHEAYFTAALHALPEWGGKPDGVARVAHDASQGAGKDARAMYARIYWAMDQRAYQGKLFAAGGADWPTMRASFEHMLTQYPGAWNLNGFAYFACMARDYKTMDTIVTRIGPGLVPALWGANGEATHARCLQHKAP